MVSAVGHISGGHFNPAVTLGFLVTGRLSPVVAGAYWVAQFGGAAAAAALLEVGLPERPPGKSGLSVVGPGFEPEAALIIEAILTFFLVWVVFATAADPRGTFKSIAGLAIGLTITLDILMAGPITGGAMNPARAFGPELLSGDWDDFWIWYIGPFAGGVLGALAYEWLYLRPLKPSGRRPARDRRRRASAGRHRPLLERGATGLAGTRDGLRFAHSFDEQLDDVAFRLGDVLVRVGQLAEHPPRQDLVERPVEDDRPEARIDLRPNSPVLLPAPDDPLEGLHRLRDLLDLLLNVRSGSPRGRGRGRGPGPAARCAAEAR